MQQMRAEREEYLVLPARMDVFQIISANHQPIVIKSTHNENGVRASIAPSTAADGLKGTVWWFYQGLLLLSITFTPLVIVILRRARWVAGPRLKDGWLLNRDGCFHPGSARLDQNEARYGLCICARRPDTGMAASCLSIFVKWKYQANYNLL